MRQENLIKNSISTHGIHNAGKVAGSCDNAFFIWLKQDLRSRRLCGCTPTFVALPSMPTKVEIIGIFQKLLKRDKFSLLLSSRYISFDHPA